MTDTPKQNDLRLVRSLYPATLVREIDELVLDGRGGYQTRQEFLLDAAQNHVLEVKYGTATNGQRQLAPDIIESAPAEAPAPTSARSAPVRTQEVPAAPPAAISNGEPVQPLRDLAETELHLGRRGAVVDDGLAMAKEEPILGLHNRDYPSLWSAVELAEETAEGPVALSDFLDRVTQRAWRYAESLRELEEQTKVKLRALYPTNFAKPQSSEEGFRAFAVGAVAKTPRHDGKVDTSGPLFSWGMCQLVREDGRLMVGLTTSAYELLENLDGLSLRWPHQPEYAECFSAYLRQHAPWDWAGFEQLMESVADSPTRVELAQRFKHWRPQWSDAMANTNAAGFVARSREWGLLEPKLVEGRYTLTEFGEAQRTGAAA